LQCQASGEAKRRLDIDAHNQPMTFAYRDVLLQMFSNRSECRRVACNYRSFVSSEVRRDVIAPSDVLDQLVRLKPSFAGASQQDAMEALRAIVDALHEENKVRAALLRCVRVVNDAHTAQQHFEPKRRRLLDGVSDDLVNAITSPAAAARARRTPTAVTRAALASSLPTSGCVNGVSMRQC
jgi:hypothetical protein